MKGIPTPDSIQQQLITIIIAMEVAVIRFQGDWQLVVAELDGFFVMLLAKVCDAKMSAEGDRMIIIYTYSLCTLIFSP